MKKLVCCFGIVLGIFSCNEKKVDPKLNNQEKIPLSQSTLVFENEEAFKDAIDNFKKNFNEKSVSEWENKHPDYISMRKAYLSVSEKDKEIIGNAKSIKGFETFLKIVDTNLGREINSQIGDPILSSLFNKEGILVVGNKVIKINNSEVFEAKNYNPSMSKKDLNFEKVGELNESFSDNVSNLKSNSNAKQKAVLYPQHGCHDVYSGDKAFTADFMMTLYASWSGGSFIEFDDISWNVKHKERSWGFWWTNRAPTLTASGSIYTSNGQGYNISASCNNCSELNDYLYFGKAFVTTDLNVSGIGDDNNSHGCNAHHDMF
jgi:hypothetical protein